jgi:hypothetical protein
MSRPLRIEYPGVWYHERGYKVSTKAFHQYGEYVVSLQHAIRDKIW